VLKRFKEGLILTMTLFMVACAGAQTVPEPESPAAHLFKERCTQCHGLPGTKRHTPEQWDHMLVLMEGFMQEKGIQFPSHEKKMIQDYLHRNGK
jgi:hypothetical protein